MEGRLALFTSSSAEFLLHMVAYAAARSFLPRFLLTPGLPGG